MKKTIAVLLSFLMLLSLCPAAAMAATGIGTLKINPYGGEESAIDTVSWFVSGGQYFLFLPADVDLTAAKVYFTASGDVALDGAAIASGGTAAAFTEGTHTLSCAGKRYSLTVCRSADIPAVFITTESGSLDYLHASKENKEPGNIRIYENGEMTLDKALKQIKGRGNATWSYDKKPYNIKFDKKTEVLGMAKAKKWTLLANYCDETLLRNAYGWEYAKAFGLHYTSDYRHVDLYINGSYLGNYVICESVEVGSTRVDVNDLDNANEEANPDVDLESLSQVGTGANGAVLPGTASGSAKWIDIPVSPEDVSGGYLLELDLAERYDEELCGFVTDVGQAAVVKSPELASGPEIRYIQTLVNDAMNALYAPDGYNAAGKHYSEYFDMDALVNMYILQELSENLDAGVTSTYLYKSQDNDRLVFSPAWDYDHAFGDEYDRFGTNIGDPDIWWANSLAYPHMLVFNAAYRHDDFQQAVRDRWTALSAAGTVADVAAAVGSKAGLLAASARMNLMRWNPKAAPDPAAADSRYAAQVSKGSSFLTRRQAALTRGFSENAAMLYYDANGGSGYIFNPQIAVVGDAVRVIDCDRGDNRISAPDGGYRFGGWNTAPDGSGATYQPGDSITLNAKTTTLYAVWKTGPGAQLKSFWQRIVDFFTRIGDFFRRLFGIA